MRCPHCKSSIVNDRAIVVEIGGEMASLRTHALDHGLTPSTVVQRYRRGDRGLRLVRPASAKYRRRIANDD